MINSSPDYLHPGSPGTSNFIAGTYGMLRTGGALLIIRSDADALLTLPGGISGRVRSLAVARRFLGSYRDELLGCKAIVAKELDGRIIGKGMAGPWRRYFSCFPTDWSFLRPLRVTLPSRAKAMLWAFDSPPPDLHPSLAWLPGKIIAPAFWVDPVPRPHRKTLEIS